MIMDVASRTKHPFLPQPDILTNHTVCYDFSLLRLAPLSPLPFANTRGIIAILYKHVSYFGALEVLPLFPLTPSALIPTPVAGLSLPFFMASFLSIE
jgi:hypothetical protein